MEENTKRLTKRIKKFLKCQYNHWLNMCKICDNDYDIHYFDSRAIVDDELLMKFEDLKLDQSKEEFNTFLESEVSKIEFQEEDMDEKDQGYLDEYRFL